MKSNNIKYFFIIFIIILIIFAVLIIKQNEEERQREEEYIAEIEENQIKEIKLGIAEFDTINPILSSNKNVQEITKLIYDPLITLTQDYRAEACLATEWAKQGDNSYIIKLRENVLWSDGKRFTSYDVKFTIDILKQISSTYSYNVQNVIGVEVIDDYTIKINLDKEVPFFEYNLTFPILSKDYYQGEDFSTTAKNSSPVGTGKYKITTTNPSYLTLEENTGWWDKKNTDLNINKITVNLYSGVGELYNSFKLGNLDVISTTNTKIQDYIGTIGYNPQIISGRDHTFLALNITDSLLAKYEVRKAIQYSIDIDSMINSVLGNSVNRASFPLDYGHWLGTNAPGSSGFSPDQAKQILIDNGWNYTNSAWQITENYKTQRLELNLLVKASDNEKVIVAENIKTQLEMQGIKININYADDTNYYNLLLARDYDIALTSVIMSPSPNLESFFGANNFANYNIDEVNRILEEVKNTNDINTLKEKYNRLYDIYITDTPYISLYNNKHTIAYNSELSGEIGANWFYQYYGIDSWYK